jgi:uncharacterized protein YbjT (DUF2867 family)
VEVFSGSHSDPRVVRAAFDGADTVFWLVPPDPKASSVDEAYMGFSRPAVAILKDSGVKRVVGISALGRGTALATNAGFVTASLAMDDLIASTGVAYRAVANPSFFDNLPRQVGAIRDRGMFFTPIDTDRKLPACATVDVATTAAGLLLDDTWSGVGHVEPRTADNTSRSNRSVQAATHIEL